MKLLHYTYRTLSLVLLLLMAAWGLFFYYTILHEVVDETDDTLRNYRDILVNTALKDPSTLETKGNIMTMYEFQPISETAAVNYEERFFNSTVYIQIEDEYEPVRVMKSCFMMPDGQYYELKIMISTLEREDMIEAILGYLLALYLMLLISIVIITRIVLKRSFLPLDRLLKWLESIQPGKKVAPLNNQTNIQEFARLNEAALAMSNRAYNAYQDQKQFIENASHELQTPLAIMKGKIELLAETESLAQEQMDTLSDIYDTLNRAIKLNKSLLLLSRIENKQFDDTKSIHINHLIEEILPDLMQVYESKNIESEQEYQEDFVCNCNYSLARVLVSNLLKNALTHNVDNGRLIIITTSKSVIIRNSGTKALDTEKVFQRFYHAQKQQKESTGLGLAIAKSIAVSYNLNLEYNWNGMHEFILSKCSTSPDGLTIVKNNI